MRIQLRDTGSLVYLFGIKKLVFGWGYNLYLGKLFIAVRRGKQGKLIDLSFGKSQREYARRVTDDNAADARAHSAGDGR